MPHEQKHQFRGGCKNRLGKHILISFEIALCTSELEALAH